MEAARLRAAEAFSIEHGVYVWVAEKSAACGVAPVVSSVLVRRHELADMCGACTMIPDIAGLWDDVGESWDSCGKAVG